MSPTAWARVAAGCAVVALAGGAVMLGWLAGPGMPQQRDVVGTAAWLFALGALMLVVISGLTAGAVAAGRGSRGPMVALSVGGCALVGLGMLGFVLA